jgi:hypothetical protein
MSNESNTMSNASRSSLLLQKILTHLGFPSANTLSYGDTGALSATVIRYNGRQYHISVTELTKTID